MAHANRNAWLLLLGSWGVPASLYWDYSWESTIGVDRFFAPPHVATDLAVAFAATVALALLLKTTRARAAGVALGRMRAPLGAWLVLWGALAFAAALVFDRWWQTGYGQAAGIWHPPQILKAVAFFAVTIGVWVEWQGRQARASGVLGFALAGGAVLSLIGVVTLASSFANLQRSAFFFQLGCATYPVVLVALAVAGRGRFPASTAALAAFGVQLALVWLLPLVPGAPEVGPVYHPRDTLLPPPFPLLLVLPALVVDLLLRARPARGGPGQRAPSALDARLALEAGLAFAAVFVLVQWTFAGFLLSPAADTWLFAGGGRHWPFFLRIDPSARAAFWHAPGDALSASRGAVVALLAVLASSAGLALGAGLARVRS
ncbi:MAG: hypothetical protein WEF50_21590 [Myxococcota bacterium]